MTEIGIFFSCEERTAPETVQAAAYAEQAGFRSAWISASDHFHPWGDEQGGEPVRVVRAGRRRARHARHALDDRGDLPDRQDPPGRRRARRRDDRDPDARPLPPRGGSGEALQAYVDAGFDEVYVAQIGPGHDAFVDFYAREVLPHVG